MPLVEIIFYGSSIQLMKPKPPLLNRSKKMTDATPDHWFWIRWRYFAHSKKI